MKLEGKVAAITGGTAGIGRGIAEAYLAEGASVALFARNPDKGAQVLEELDAGPRAIFISGNVMEQDEVEGFVDKAQAEFGRLDILVNNAGGGSDLQPLVNLSDASFEQAIRWNLFSNFWASRRALPGMIERKWGRIVSIASVEGKHGKPVMTAYTAAKHAVIGLTKSLAREVGEAGVTANCICPGLVITDIIREVGPATAEAMGITFDELVAMYTEESAIKRPVAVEEVAAVAVLLASEAGAGISGAAISVDGGTAQF